MTDHEKRLDYYRLQLERLQEMHTARQAREDELRRTVQRLSLQAEELRRQLWLLKFEQFNQPTQNCHARE